MAEADPDDDTQQRWVVRWYRYDPERRERRHTFVAAYTTEDEFLHAVANLRAELAVRQARGEAEPREYISGVVVPAGYRAETQRRRAEERQRRQEWKSREASDEG